MNTRQFLILLTAFILSACNLSIEVDNTQNPQPSNPEHSLLTEPFLQKPSSDSVNVVWFTNFKGKQHQLIYAGSQVVDATTTKLTRMMEDADSRQLGKEYKNATFRTVYRHEAVASDLTAGQRETYFVRSIDQAGQTFASGSYSLTPAPASGSSLKILLTSDLQSKKNVVANYQKVVETIGHPDAVLFAGDFVNIPDRASEWFDQAKNDAPAFFPALQGRYQQYMPESEYTGGAILQYAPLFGTIGNHEVMGRFQPSEDYKINAAFNDPQPKWYAEIAYQNLKEQINPTNDPLVKKTWIQDQSHNQMSFLDIFSFPDDGPAGESYYATQFGDVFIISMNVSRIWRAWSVSGNNKSKFVEQLSQLKNPEQWGFGEFLFERFDKGSTQYNWLVETLNSDAFQNSKYKVLMAHQSVFGLGDNSVPVLTNPIMQLVETSAQGEETITELSMPISQQQWQEQVVAKLDKLSEIRYQYPLNKDIWLNDIEPLLIEKGVDLVHVGHSHVWNRAKVDSLNYLETSNVGNSYGAYFDDTSGVYQKNVRSSYADFWQALEQNNPHWLKSDYPASGDPHERAMQYPSLFSPMDAENNDYPNLPFVASNQLTVFSILDTASGTVKSYVFDVADSDSEVKLFDEFKLN